MWKTIEALSAQWKEPENGTAQCYYSQVSDEETEAYGD